MKLKVLASGSKANCYLLIGEKEILILEAGLDYRDILKGLHFDISKVIGTLVTHEHMDHVRAIKDLTQKGIDIYASKGTLEKSMPINHRAHIVKSEEQFKLGGFTVLPFEVQHDAAEPLGFLIHHNEMGKLLFITDSYYCKYNFKGLNHILLECNHSNKILRENVDQGIVPVSLSRRIIKSHFSVDNAKEFLKASDIQNVREIVLIHLSGDNSDPKEFISVIEKATGKVVYIARKGLEIDLSIF